MNIGCIYATGHNTCYLEPFADKAEQPMILNLESGGFNRLAPGRFDVALDERSEKPGEQRLEKMVSGRYMGELFGMALAELLGEVLTNSTKKNLTMRIDAEHGACAGKKELATLAKQLGLDAVHDTVHEMAKDEARHGRGFKGLFDRYFGE